MAALDPVDAAMLESRTAAPAVRRAGLGIGFWVAAAWVALVFLLAATADWLPLADPAAMDLINRLATPSATHFLGTDAFGRDILTRVIFGARASLTIGLGAALGGVLVGGALGLIAGYFRGWMERITVASMDVLFAFPPLVLALAIAAYLGKSLSNLTAIFALLTVPASMRVARAVTLSFAQREFVAAARALGATHLRILLHELLPNIVFPMVVFSLLAVAVIIVAEGALSFIGLGLPAPTPSWGSMIAEGRDSLDTAPHVAFIPALVLFLTVLAFNFIGDRLRAFIDPDRGTA